MGESETKKRGIYQRQNMERLQKLLAGPAKLPALEFDRFDMSGLSVKGQRSSGFGEIGFQAMGGIKIDFGKFLMPGLVTLEAGAKLTGQVARRSLVVVQRDAGRMMTRRITAKDDDKFVQWRNSRPVSLAILSGTSGMLQLEASSKARFGIGDAMHPDELGLAVGAEITLTGSFEAVTLDTRRVAYFSGARHPDFEAAFDYLLNQKIKQSVVLFLKRTKQTQSGKFSFWGYLNDMTPDSLLPPQIEQVFRIPTADGDDLTTEDDLWDADMKATLDDSAFGVQFGARGVIKSLTRHYSSRYHGFFKSYTTAEVQAELARLQARVKSDLIDESLGKSIKDTRNDIVSGKLTGDNLITGIERIRRYEAIKAVLDNIEAASRALAARADRKTGKSVLPYALRVEGVPEKLRSKFRAWSVSGSINAQAGAKANLNAVQLIGAEAGVKTTAEGLLRRIAYTYRSASAPNVDGTAKRAIVTREETVIDYKILTAAISTEAKAYLGDEKKSEAAWKKTGTYGTMTYRTLRACTLADRNGKPVGKSVLPNGSGVILGMTLNVGWARKHVKWSVEARDAHKQLAKDAAPKKPTTAATKKLEEELRNKRPKASKKLIKALGRSLMVNAKSLEAFFAEADLLLDLNPDVAIIVEAGYEPIHDTTYDSDHLKDMKFVEKRLKQKKPDADTAKGDGVTRLQVLRLRLRLRDLESKTSVIGGYGAVQDSTLMGQGVSREGFEALAFRSFRAEHESTWDLHTQYYGPMAADFNKYPEMAAEHTIAPVALFSF